MTKYYFRECDVFPNDTIEQYALENRVGTNENIRMEQAYKWVDTDNVYSAKKPEKRITPLFMAHVVAEFGDELTLRDGTPILTEKPKPKIIGRLKEGKREPTFAWAYPSRHIDHWDSLTFEWLDKFEDPYDHILVPKKPDKRIPLGYINHLLSNAGWAVT